MKKCIAEFARLELVDCVGAEQRGGVVEGILGEGGGVRKEKCKGIKASSQTKISSQKPRTLQINPLQTISKF